MMDNNYFVYIITNPGKTVLYTGVTNDLFRRLNEHYSEKGKPKTFAGRYYCYKLLYFERHDDILIAIEREKEIKDMSRQRKLDLIKSSNPEFTFIRLTPE